jgi:hypothetical protein
MAKRLPSARQEGRLIKQEISNWLAGPIVKSKFKSQKENRITVLQLGRVLNDQHPFFLPLMMGRSTTAQ